jgi:hypothetical protein
VGTNKKERLDMSQSKSRIIGRGKTPLQECRSGMAVPMVIIFVVFMGIFIGSMTYNRMTVKRQTKTTFEYLGAHYMAQSALQHMSLKLRLLPNEAYDSSAISLGICPFNAQGDTGIGTLHAGPLEVFRGDVSTLANPAVDNVVRGYPLTTGVTDNSIDGFDGATVDDGWNYRITMANALTAFTDGDTRVLVIEIQAEGRASSFNSHNLLTQRIETIKKTIEIKRSPEEVPVGP